MKKILLLSLGVASLIAGQALTDVVDPSSATKLAEGFTWTEGALWDKKNTRLAFADTNANKLKFMPNGNPPAQDQFNSFNGINGQVFDTKGNRIMCQQLGRKLTKWNADGTYVDLATNYQGLRINSPNDLAIWKDGSIFFSDPPYGVSKDNEELGYYAFWRVYPNGNLEMVTKEFNRPNGIAFSPDGSIVYVNDIEAGSVWKFPVDPTTGNWNLAGKALFTTAASWPDGMKTDVQGNVYIVGAQGLSIFAPSGTLIGRIGGFEGTNLAFGDADFKTIYITAKTQVWRVQGKIAGLATDGSFGVAQTSAPTTPTQQTSSSSAASSTTAATSSTQETSETSATSSSGAETSTTTAPSSTTQQTSQQTSQTSQQTSQTSNPSDPATCEQSTDTNTRASTSRPDAPIGASGTTQVRDSSPALALRPELIGMILVGAVALMF